MKSRGKIVKPIKFGYMTVRQVKFWLWLAGLVPRKLVYFCIINVFAEVSTSKFKRKTAGKITLLEALLEWEASC